jgi:hypothetical protein
MPTIDLTAAGLAAVTAAIRRDVERDRFPRAPRLGLLRSALAKPDPAVLPRALAAESAGPAPSRQNPKGRPKPFAEADEVKSLSRATRFVVRQLGEPRADGHPGEKSAD